MWMQHATPDELVDTGLLAEEEFLALEKFTIVRHPLDRLVSDYLWLSRRRKSGPLKDFLSRVGAYEFLKESGTKTSRFNHFRPQSDYLTLRGELAEIRQFRFEDYGPGMLSEIHEMLNTDADRRIQISHRNASALSKRDSLSFLTDEDLTLASSIYERDFVLLGYVPPLIEPMSSTRRARQRLKMAHLCLLGKFTDSWFRARRRTERRMSAAPFRGCCKTILSRSLEKLRS